MVKKGAPSPYATNNATNMTYHGGSVITSPALYLDFWGWQNFNDPATSALSVETYVQTFFNNIGGTFWLGTDSQYCQSIASGGTSCSGAKSSNVIQNPASELLGTWLDTTNTLPSQPTDAQVATEAQAEWTHFGKGNNAVYFVLTPPGHSSPEFPPSGNVCAYHNWQVDPLPNIGNIRYAYLPYQPDAGGSCYQYQVNPLASTNAFGNGYLDGYSIVGGHEFTEAITDPDSSAWYDSTGSTGGENGDKCDQTGSKQYPTPYGNIVLRSHFFAVQGEWSNFHTGCLLPGRPTTYTGGIGSHNLALEWDNSYWGWGDNGEGAVGVGNTTAVIASPTQVVAPVGNSGTFGNADTIITTTAAYHASLAVIGANWAYAWGDNQFGQLGNPSYGSTNAPVLVSASGGGPLSPIVDSACGAYHCLGLVSGGNVWTWGADDSGQLGSGNANDIPNPTPVEVKAASGKGYLSSIIAVAGGLNHSLALASNGTVWAWGNNSSGQLGNSSTNNSSLPVQVSQLTNVVAIAANGAQSMALKADGTVWMWGNGVYGQLGNGLVGAGSVVPEEVLDPTGSSHLTGVVAIASGWYHSLALGAGGTVWGWGDNSFGQLGTGSTTSPAQYPLPAVIPQFSTSLVTSIGAGYEHSLAVTFDGSFWAWGDNFYGELGNGQSGGFNETPTKVPGIASAAQR